MKYKNFFIKEKSMEKCKLTIANVINICWLLFNIPKHHWSDAPLVRRIIDLKPHWSDAGNEDYKVIT